jgi:hypothetical protein
MKSIFTKLLLPLAFFSAAEMGAQCNILTAINAQPDSAGSLSYMIVGTHNASANATYYMSINPGPTFYGQDTVNYTFPVGGAYTICWSVSDSVGSQYCTTMTCDSVNVGSTPNTCGSFIVNSNNGLGGYVFTATPNAPNGWVVSYMWSFGDGTAGTGNPLTHNYPNNGAYTISVYTYAYDPNDSTQNCSGTSSTTITVQGAPGTGNCSASFSITNNGGGSYSFTNTSTTADSSYTAFSSWSVDNMGAGNNANLAYTFSTTGVHVICLQQWFIDNVNYDTCFAYTCDTVMYGTGAPCQAAFSLWADSLNPTVWYGINQSSGNNLTYLWDFGDGTSSTQQFPTHTYNATGFYQICLTVTDSAANCTSTYCDSAGVFHLIGPGISSLTILSSVTGIKEQAAGITMNVAPNPVNENSNVIINTEKQMKVTMNIVNLMGQIVSTEQVVINPGKNIIPLHTTALPDGVYFLTINDGIKNLKNIKLVK